MCNLIPLISRKFCVVHHYEMIKRFLQGDICSGVHIVLETSNFTLIVWPIHFGQWVFVKLRMTVKYITPKYGDLEQQCLCARNRGAQPGFQPGLQSPSGSNGKGSTSKQMQGLWAGLFLMSCWMVPEEKGDPTRWGSL